MEGKDTVRFWAGALGAMALVAAIVAVVVMVRMPPPKSSKAAAPATTKPAQTAKSTAPVAKPAPPATKPATPVASATPPPAAKPAPAVAKAAPQTTVAAKAPAPAPAKPQPQPTATAAAKPAPAATKPLTDAERKVSEELWVEQKKVDTASSRMTSTSDGRRRVAETIAKQFNVSDKVVTDLRGRSLGYGEMVSTLAFSQQLMKHDKITRQQAIDKIIAARKAGQGWAAYARAAGVKIGDVLTDVRTTDKQLSKLVMVKAER
jgi:hypothetical protein